MNFAIPLAEFFLILVALLPLLWAILWSILIERWRLELFWIMVMILSLYSS